MIKRTFLILLCVNLIILTASSLTYFSEDIFISPGEKITIRDLPVNSDDYESNVFIQLDDNESFYGHVVEVRSRMFHSQGDICSYTMELYAFDKYDHNDIIEDSITHSGNADWSETALIDVTIDAETARILFYFDSTDCVLSSQATIDVEIAVDYEDIPVSIQFWADDTTIPRGQCTYLNWEVDHSTSVSMDGSPVNPYDYTYVCPDETTTYTLSVTAQDGSVHTETVTIVVEDRPPAKIDFWADNNSILTGGCTQLHWEISDTENLETTLNNIPKFGSTGVETVCLTETTEYSLCAHGLDGEFRCERLVIEVIDARFWPEKPSVHKGECSELYWEVEGAAGGQAWFEGTAFQNFDSTKVCPDNTETYELCFTGSDGVEKCLQVTIEVEGGAPYLLVITHSVNLNAQTKTPDAWEQVESWINSRYSSASIIDLHQEGISATDFAAIDQAVEDRIREFGANPQYLLVIGGPAVVAYGQLDNPMLGQACRTNALGVRTCDSDTLLTDDLYGDVNHDANNVPEIPVARLPDGADFEIYRIHFEQDFPRGSSYDTNYLNNYAVGQPFRSYVGMIGAIMNASAVKYAPPTIPSNFNGLWGRWLYFILHGNQNDTTQWWGEELVNGKKTYPLAWDVSVSKHWEVVVSGACYGGYLGEPASPRNTTNSIALSFLRHGARAFMGYTVTSYSPRGTEMINVCDGTTCTATPIENVDWSVSDGDALLGAEVFRAMNKGSHPLDAFHSAKQALAGSLGPALDAELKDMRGFQFYGLPPFNEISF